MSHHLVAPIERPYRNCCSGWIQTREMNLVEIRTDSGLVGWGEGDGMPSLEAIDKFVIGWSPFDFEMISDNLTRNGCNRRLSSGIEIALWDLMGKKCGVPVYELLGVPRRKKVSAYASGFFERAGVDHVADLTETANCCMNSGFDALKIRIGFGLSQDERVVEAVRTAIGSNVAVSVDANTGYDLANAIDVGKRLEKYDLMWFEEPIDSQNLEGYYKIREALSLRISGGESFSDFSSFGDLVGGRVVDVLQPDIGRVGGFMEGRRICDLAFAHGIHVIPHMFGGVVRLAATLQWLATIPDDPFVEDKIPTYLEWDIMENGLRTDLAILPFKPEDGILAIPDRPGLGVEIDEEALRRFSV